MRLKDKIAVITGAGSGMGKAMAELFSAEGARIVCADISGKQDAVAGSIGEAAVPLHVDVSKEEDIQRMIATAEEKFGRLDILVNNAGVGYLFGPLVEATQEMWDTVLDVNLRGAFFATKHAVRQMLTQEAQEGWGRGRIVSIGSRGSKSGSALTSSYIASKHGLVGLTRSAAIELGPEQITVNAVCPNHVTTGLGAWQNDYMAKARGQSGLEHFHEIRSAVATGKPKEISHPIYERLDATGVRDGAWREQSRRLLDEPELRYWILTDEWVRDFVAQVEAAQSSRLVLNPLQKEERLSAIVRDAVRALCSGENGQAFKRRMEDMALYFFETNRKELAALSLAVALQCGEGDPGPLDVSFLTGLMQKSFAVLMSQEKTKKEEDRSSLIIKP